MKGREREGKGSVWKGGNKGEKRQGGKKIQVCVMITSLCQSCLVLLKTCFIKWEAAKFCHYSVPVTLALICSCYSCITSLPL